MTAKTIAAILLLLSWPLSSLAASPWVVTAEGSEFLGVGLNRTAMSGDVFASLGSGSTVHVFERDDDQWREIDSLQAPEGEAGQGFGYALEIQDNVLVVTAPERSVNGMPSAGAAYVFQRGAGDGWQFVTRLTAADAREDARFGHSVRIDGDNIFVSAFRPGSELGEPPEGAIYVFSHDDTRGSWLERAKLESPPEFLPTVYGPTFDVSGETIAVGMSREAVVLVYEDTGRGWQETHRLRADTQADVESLGTSIGIEGDTIVAAASDEYFEGEGDPGGRVYVFERDGEDWQMTAELRSPDTTGFQFGSGMQFGAGLIAINKQRDNVAYLFSRNDAGEWQHVANIDNPDLHPGGLSAAFSVHDITPDYLLVSGDEASVVVYQRSDLLPGEDDRDDDRDDGDNGDDVDGDSDNGSDNGSDDDSGDSSDTGNGEDTDDGGSTVADDNDDGSSGDGGDGDSGGTGGTGGGNGADEGATRSGGGGGAMTGWMLPFLLLAIRLRAESRYRG